MEQASPIEYNGTILGFGVKYSDAAAHTLAKFLTHLLRHPREESYSLFYFIYYILFYMKNKQLTNLGKCRTNWPLNRFYLQYE